jgi:Ca2+-binding EF-hand superfamily protein
VAVAEPSDYADTFRLIDTDGDGLISAAEFKRLMATLGDEFTDDAAAEAVRIIDGNGDGLVDLTEFAAYFDSRG